MTCDFSRCLLLRRISQKPQQGVASWKSSYVQYNALSLSMEHKRGSRAVASIHFPHHLFQQ